MSSLRKYSIKDQRLYLPKQNKEPFVEGSLQRVGLPVEDIPMTMQLLCSILCKNFFHSNMKMQYSLAITVARLVIASSQLEVTCLMQIVKDSAVSVLAIITISQKMHKKDLL